MIEVNDLKWERQNGVYFSKDISQFNSEIIITKFRIEKYNGIHMYDEGLKYKKRNYNGWLIKISGDNDGTKICDTLEETKRYCLDYIN